MVGTPTYISPEQARGDKTDFRSDMYSLGVTLYEFVMGEPPFVADSTMTVLMKHLTEPVRFPVLKDKLPLPLPMTGVIRKMMAKKPDGRYLSYDHLIEALSALQGKIETAHPVEPGTNQSNIPTLTKIRPVSETLVAAAAAKNKRRGVPAWLKVGIAAGVLIVTYFGFQQWSEPPIAPPPTTKVIHNSNTAPPLRRSPAGRLTAAPQMDSEPIELTIDPTAIASMVEKIDDTTYRIFGTIRNLGTEPIQKLMVEVSLIDEFDEVLSKLQSPAEPSLILSGESTRFSILFKNVENFAQHEITLLETASRRTTQ